MRAKGPDNSRYSEGNVVPKNQQPAIQKYKNTVGIGKREWEEVFPEHKNPSMNTFKDCSLLSLKAQ